MAKDRSLLYIFSAAALSGTSYLLLKWNSQRIRKKPKGEEGVTEVPRISKDKVAEFFFAANESITKTMVLVEQQLAQYRGQVPEEQLASVIIQQFEEQLRDHQDATLRKWGYSEEELEAAMLFYEDEADVKQGVNRLRNMYKAVTSEVVEEIPEDLTEDLFAEALIEYYETATNVMKSIIEKTQAMRQRVDKSTWMEEVMRRFQREQDTACTEVLEKYGMHSEMMTAALTKFSNSKKIVTTFAECQQKQQEEFELLGLA